MRTTLLATFALLLTAMIPDPAVAVTADAVCAPTANPCVLPPGEVVEVPVDSTLDFGSRAVIMAAGSGTKIQISPGVLLTIRAGSLTMNAGSGIIGPTASVVLDLAGDLVVARDGNSRARIDVADDLDPGSITIVTDVGDVIIDGIIDARGKSTDAGFGSIDLLAGRDVSLAGEIRASGLGLAGGGEVVIAAAEEVNVSGFIDASGSDGGVIDVSAGARIVTTGGATARLDARASFGGGSGGEVTLTTPGNVSLGTPVHVQGEASRDFGGDGGFLSIDAGRTVTLASALNAFGTFPDGAGGEIDIVTGLDLVQTGPIDAVGKATFGLGGIVSMIAERNAFLGTIDTSADCPSCDGGEIDVQAWCALAVPPSATLSAIGSGGVITFEAGSSLTIAGILEAGDLVELLHHPDAGTPDLAGATIVPAPLDLTDSNVVPCGGPVDRNCGDGVTDPVEECDDGNRIACDGCSSSCRDEGPGNGRVECLEVCDDGNQVSCDGCSADLSREDDVCGDGIQECDEECDDGNATSCDGCTATCRTERCGNGIPECGEECDLGDALNGSPDASCDGTCRLQAPATCGDGVTDAPFEQCDDGGVDCDAGGCSSLCRPEVCGNGRQECLEECDDFNTDPCDGCSPSCIVERCGNGVVECGEECDEGEANGTPGSACLAVTCRAGFVCNETSPTDCIPCADDFDCTPGGRCGGMVCDTGVCLVAPIDCDDANPCTRDICTQEDGCSHELLDAADVPACIPSEGCSTVRCDATLGCVETILTDFPGVRCELDRLGVDFTDPSVDPKAQRKLSILLTKLRAKIDLAEAGEASGNARKVKKGLKKSARFLTKLRRKTEHFTGPRIPLGIAAQMVSTIDDAAARVDAMRAERGLL